MEQKTIPKTRSTRLTSMAGLKDAISQQDWEAWRRVVARNLQAADIRIPHDIRPLYAVRACYYAGVREPARIAELVPLPPDRLWQLRERPDGASYWADKGIPGLLALPSVEVSQKR